MASEVSFQGTVNTAYLQALSERQIVYLLLEAKPVETSVDVRMSLNLGFVLDHSGSMEGEKLDQLKQAVKLALESLQPSDVASLVVFNDQVSVPLAAQQLRDPNGAACTIGPVQADGGTRISKGIANGLKEIRKNLGTERVSRMVLLTDGQTQGDERDCRTRASECGEMKVPITALGLGDDWNSRLLEDIAERSGGVAEWLDSPDKITSFFQRQVERMQASVIRNAVLTLHCTAGVQPQTSYRVYPSVAKLGYESMTDREVRVPLGELEKGEGQAILIELTVPARQLGRFRVAQAELSFDVPHSGAVGRREAVDCIITFTEEAGPAHPDGWNSRIMAIVERAGILKLRESAEVDLAKGENERATKKLQSLTKKLEQLGDAAGAHEAAKALDEISKTGSVSSSTTIKLTSATKKLVSGTVKLTRE